MIRKNIYIIFTLLIFTLLMAEMFIFFNSKYNSKNSSPNGWIAYFAPTDTAIAYGDNNAVIVEFDLNGIIKYHKVDAYPLAGMLKYNNKLIFQIPNGLAQLDSDLKNLDITIKEKTCGYNMFGVIPNKNIYYFLRNESFKNNFYSSKLLLGNSYKQYSHQIQGFVQGYGNDQNDIYILTTDMKDKYSKEIQKISVNSSDNIVIKKNKLKFNSQVDSTFKMMVNDNYIYCFVIKNNSIYLLKISKNTLEIENEFNLMKNESDSQTIYSDVGDFKDYPMSKYTIFYLNDKIYYPSKEGKVYSFNVTTNKFVEEFSIKDYDYIHDFNMSSFYNASNNTLSFFYLDSSTNKYCLQTYDLKGNQKNKLQLNDLNVKSNLYPHTFIDFN